MLRCNMATLLTELASSRQQCRSKGRAACCERGHGVWPSLSLAENMSGNNSYNVLEDPLILSKLQPTEYYKRWLEKYPNRRVDGRGLEESRPLQISLDFVSTAESSSTVRLGDTLVVTGIKYEVAEPKLEAPEAGYIICNVSLAAGCSPVVRAGPPSERAQMLSDKVGTLLKRLDVLDQGALTIESGKLVWAIYIDAIVLNDAGNAFDAAWLGILSALKGLRLPRVEMDPSSGLIQAYPNPLTDVGPLTLDSLPIAVSFMKASEVIIVDPSFDEEAAFNEGTGTIIFRVSDQDDTVLLHSESDSISPSLLAALSKSALIDTSLKSIRDTIIRL